MSKQCSPIVIMGYNESDFKTKFNSMIKACSNAKELGVEIRKIREDIAQRKATIESNRDLIHNMTADNMKSEKELRMLEYLNEHLSKYHSELALEERT